MNVALLDFNASTQQQPPPKEILQSKKKSRMYYLDKLRTFLTLLVVVHHCFWVVFGWFPFYDFKGIDHPTEILSIMILSGNQAYFMGLFFFLSGLVTGPSLLRKGSILFLKDRLIRLITPVVLYELVFFPLLFWFVQDAWYGKIMREYPTLDIGSLGNHFGADFSAAKVWSSYFKYYDLTQNHLWFLVLLFTFSVVTVVVVQLQNSWVKYLSSSSQSEENLPLNNQKESIRLLIKFSFLMFLLVSLIRLPLLINPTNFHRGFYVWVPIIGNLGFIGQYIIAFILGILANHFEFLDNIKKEHMKSTVVIAVFFYFLYQVFQTYAISALQSALSFYVWVLFTTFFEQFYAVFWSYSLLGLFKEYQNAEPTDFISKIIGAAYATYIVHQWIVIPLAVGFAYTSIYSLVIILILSIITPVLSWGAGLLLKSIPGSSKVL